MNFIGQIAEDPSRLAIRPGAGMLEVESAGGRTVVTRAQANSPLKLLFPRTGCHSAWVYQSTYGGGLLGGDEVRLNVRVGAGATCLLGTQSATKIYPRLDGRGCRQSIDLKIEAGALAVVAPDPLVCFSGAELRQSQRFDLDATAGLVVIDALASGRRARGERWAMHRYESRSDIFVSGEHVFRDALRLDNADGPIDGRHRMGRFDCIVTVLLIGPALRTAVAKLLAQTDKKEFACSAPGPFVASPITGGLLLRSVGNGPESIGRWIREVLWFVPALLGDDPWARKW